MKTAVLLKRIFCALIMVVAVAAVVLGQMASAALGEKVNFEEGRYRYDVSAMQSYALEIAVIRSVGGKTLEEAYYQEYGQYLSDMAELQANIAKDLGEGLNQVGRATEGLSEKYGALGQLGFAGICLFAGIAFLCALYQLLLTFDFEKKKKQEPVQGEVA